MIQRDLTTFRLASFALPSRYLQRARQKKLINAIVKLTSLLQRGTERSRILFTLTPLRTREKGLVELARSLVKSEIPLGVAGMRCSS